MINDIKLMFKTISPAEAIAAELAEAEHALLRSETGVEWAQASVTYNKNRIKRLKASQAPVEEKT
jgi:hypothetical protein